MKFNHNQVHDSKLLIGDRESTHRTLNTNTSIQFCLVCWAHTHIQQPQAPSQNSQKCTSRGLPLPACMSCAARRVWLGWHSPSLWCHHTLRSITSMEVPSTHSAANSSPAGRYIYHVHISNKQVACSTLSSQWLPSSVSHNPSHDVLCCCCRRVTHVARVASPEAPSASATASSSAAAAAEFKFACPICLSTEFVVQSANP